MRARLISLAIFLVTFGIMMGVESSNIEVLMGDEESGGRTNLVGALMYLDIIAWVGSMLVFFSTWEGQGNS